MNAKITDKTSHPVNSDSACRSLRREWLLAATFLGAAILAPAAHAADPDGHASKSFTLLKTIPVPTTLKALYGFDISWFDATTQRYYLADRSNAAVDVVDAATGTFIAAIKGDFAGVKFNAAGAANSNISGPNGVLSSGRWLFATDGGSHVVSVDLASNAVVSSVVTSTSVNRADELAYDPASGTLLVVNNADSPPFATVIKVNQSTGQLTVGTRVVFDAAHGVDATNGVEQPVWDPVSGKFYISVPQVGPNLYDGGVARVSLTGAIEALYPAQFCQPAGLTLGPNQTLLLGCGQIFDTAGAAWVATGTTTAAPLSILMNAATGATVNTVYGISGSDEVWYSSGDQRYYLAARGSQFGPVIGVVDSQRNSLVELIPTVNVAGKANVYPAGTSHSVAVNSARNEVYVPLPANNVYPSCLNGCIGVYGAQAEPGTVRVNKQ